VTCPVFGDLDFLVPSHYY